MNPQTSPEAIARWKRLLQVSDTTTNELYDKDQGIKQHILRAFGFHDEYLSYSATTASRSAKRLKSAGNNWSSASKVYAALRTQPSVKLLYWAYASFYNQLRVGPGEVSRGHTTHTRGVFIDRSRSLFAVYEPRKYEGQICPWFGTALNDFAKRYKSYTRIIIYGDQQDTHNCEKRTLRFGLCCWETFLASLDERPKRDCSCGLTISHTTAFYLRK